MTRTISFYGASDDLFEVEGTDINKGEPDEIGCYDCPAVVKLVSKEGSMCVVGMYAPGDVPCWSIGLMQSNEGERMPKWEMAWSSRAYTPFLTVEAPDDTSVVDMTDSKGYGGDDE